MKKFTHRLLPLALCFTLILGAFAYRPPQAKAVAGVDDAIVIGALLTAFAGGMGLIFSNNGMTSGQIADGMANKWSEYNDSVNGGAQTFAGWLGYDSIDALWSDIKLSSKSSFTIPVIVARKFAEFTKWFVDDLGLSVGGSVPALSAASVTHQLADIINTQQSSAMGKDNLFYNTYPYYSAYSGIGDYPYVMLASESPFTVSYQSADDIYPQSGFYVLLSKTYQSISYFGFRSLDTTSWAGSEYKPKGDKRYIFLSGNAVVPLSTTDFSFVLSLLNALKALDLSDDAASPTLSGVGWDASTIEELLQQILEQVEANTLAPTLEGVDTNTGGNTGTDEDAKPYLPYIPRIFEKLGEIPSAIAEKIGAFFTTLWGWLQKVLDAIVSIPATVAEKVGELFKPDEALVTEITDTFKGKFGFLPTLKQFGDDLFGMTAETDPPVIWVHLEDAESKYGYVYGDKQKMLDLTWYQKYKPTVDGLLSGFLWLGYLWLLFKRAPSILNGMSMEGGLLPPLQTGGDVIDAPRIGYGDPSMHYGNGFTFRDKGGRRK